jgi:hypothetical protein
MRRGGSVPREKVERVAPLGATKGGHLKKLVVFAALATFAATLVVGSASANHSWGKYHWARTSNPFTIDLGNNTTQPWSGILSTVSSDWSQSTVLDTRVVSSNTNRTTCDPTLGRVEVCNANYGDTGWLGVAQIWIYRGGSHIAQGTVKLNDYYFGSSSYQYNNSAEQLHVICQEVGHTFGLDHQSETGESLNTCMDYYHNTSSSDTLSTHPNQGDYDELLCIYDPTYAHKVLSSGGHRCRGSGHLDSFDSAGAGAAAGSFPGAGPSFAPGIRIGKSKYVEQRPDGTLVVTWITWANR